MSKALSGFTVVDLTSSVAGPYCTMLLADLGATVIKIEQPGEGDITRRNSPEIKGTRPVFTAYNRNKKSVALDLHRQEGVDLVKKLLEHADILIDDFLPGKLKEMGLDYGSLKDNFPHLICASVTGYGEDGEDSARPVFEGSIQAESGMTISLVHDSEGTPYLVGGNMAQIAGGFYTAIAIQAAAHQLTETGKGQKIVTNMYSAMLSMFTFSVSDYVYNGVECPVDGNAPNGFVRSSTGWLRITCGDGPIWARTVKLIQDPVLSEERFNDPAVRNEHRKLLISRVEKWTENYTTDEVIRIFTENGIPCGSVRTIEDLKNDPHLIDRGHIVEIDVPGYGPLPYFGSPFRLEASPVEYERAPALGEHTREVLSQYLSLSHEEFAELREAGILA